MTLPSCAICSVDPAAGTRGTNATTRICPKCRADPANIDWVESTHDRFASSGRTGILEEFLFQNVRRIVREEMRAALAEFMVRGPVTPPAGGADYLSVDQAAKVARLHHSTVREWIKDGSLKAFRVGRVYRVRRADLDERLTARVAEPISAGIDERVSAMLLKKAGRTQAAVRRVA